MTILHLLGQVCFTYIVHGVTFVHKKVQSENKLHLCTFVEMSPVWCKTPDLTCNRDTLESICSIRICTTRPDA